MNIDIGIGIGEGSFASQGSVDRLYAIAWATAGNPSVSTSSVVHKTVNAVPATSTASGLAPIVSNAKNVNVLSVIANVNSVALIPIVAIAGSISINAVIVGSNLDSIIPVVSTVRNVSVSGIVANSTTSAGVPTVSVGSGSSYYLQMDGVDDRLVTPSFSYTKLIIDFTPKRSESSSTPYYISSGLNHHFYSNTTVDYYTHIGTLSSLKVDGISVTNNSRFISDNVRHALELIKSSVETTSYNIMSRNDGLNRLKADVYDVKFYNGASLVAHYDMATGTIQDQSGNGNHATLTGGTWVVA